MGGGYLVDSRQHLLDELLKRILPQLDPNDSLQAAFAPWFCQRLSLELLTSLDPALAADWVQKSVEFLRTRTPGPLAIRSLVIESAPLSPGLLVQLWMPDQPFILDSLTEFLHSRYASIYLVSHPVLPVRWDAAGRFQALDEQGEPHCLVTLVLSEFFQGDRDAFVQDLTQVMQAAQVVTQDFAAMTDLVRRFGDQGPLAGDEATRERQGFFTWLLEDNAVLLGSCCLDPQQLEQPQLGQPLGLARLVKPPEASQDAALLAKYAGYFLRSGLGVNLFALEALSPVHKREPILLVATQEALPNGQSRIWLLQILFTNHAHRLDCLSIPLARFKVRQVIRQFAGEVERHLIHRLRDFFTALPKQELFRLDPDELLRLAEQLQLFREFYKAKLYVYYLPERSYVRLTFCLSSRNFTPQKFDRINQILAATTGQAPELSYFVSFGSNTYSYHVYFNGELNVLEQLPQLEAQVQAETESWLDELYSQMANLPPFEAQVFKERYAGAFKEPYRSLFSPREALLDMAHLEHLHYSNQLQVDFRPQQTFCLLLIYSKTPFKLAGLMPVLINLGLLVVEENSFVFEADLGRAHLYSFQVDRPPGIDLQALGFKEKLVELLRGVLEQRLEDDPLNGLLFRAGLSAKQIQLAQLYRNYLWQLGSPYSKATLHQAMLNNPLALARWVELFEAMFAPGSPLPPTQIEAGQALVLEAIAQAQTLAEDVVLKTLLNLLLATVRSNYYLNLPGTAMAIKLRSAWVKQMPLPRPLFEIYVHGANLEGIHLRSAKIARGGLRHSDRPDDFRTEVLSLMKTQRMKNVVIVPEGSKGGFILKRQAPDRAAQAKLVEQQYQIYVKSLLSLTDNIVKDQVVAPPGLTCYDEPDPYLVVAADKGTAHLSDKANQVSLAMNYWLGDAFASGGSAGYDHKAMGITARGAWENVTLHFLEQGIDIQTTPFTVVGIGDMSGDVFGNGMLLSPQTRLVAAFNHQHLFLDPDPDPAISLQERRRLFATPGSSWADYDPRLISPGGGVYARQAKSISLSPQVQQLLGTSQAQVSGLEAIRLCLTAKVDLLWNGGIGTYVKASTESHHEVGDPANDEVRVDANQLRTRVAGEGGNLGFTQRGRVEYALTGGAINTDAIDNSGGVDTSDHEVNLKILLAGLQRAGQIRDQGHRDQVLHALTDEVASQVLADNRSQGLILSMDQRRSQRQMPLFLDWMQFLSVSGFLDRRTEALSSNAQLLDLAKQGKGIPRPDLAVLLSYTKLYAFQQLLHSPLLQDPAWEALYLDYYPAGLKSAFNPLDAKHPLQREITVTLLMNRVINQAGMTLIPQVTALTDRGVDEIFVSYYVLEQALDLGGLRRLILGQAALPLEEVYRLWMLVETSLADMVGQQLAEPEPLSLQPQRIPALAAALRRFQEISPAQALPPELGANVTAPFSDALTKALLPLEQAKRGLQLLGFAQGLGLELALAWELWNLLEGDFGFSALRQELLEAVALSPWETKHKKLLVQDSHHLQQAFGRAVLGFPGSLAEQYAAFRREHQEALAHFQQEMQSCLTSKGHQLSAISVIFAQFRAVFA